MKRTISRRPTTRRSKSYKVAFTVLQFSHYPHQDNALKRGHSFLSGTLLYDHWTRTLGLCHRLDLMLRAVRAAIECMTMFDNLGTAAEDCIRAGV